MCDFIPTLFMPILFWQFSCFRVPVTVKHVQFKFLNYWNLLSKIYALLRKCIVLFFYFMVSFGDLLRRLFEILWLNFVPSMQHAYVECGWRKSWLLYPPIYLMAVNYQLLQFSAVGPKLTGQVVERWNDTSRTFRTLSTTAPLFTSLNAACSIFGWDLSE